MNTASNMATREHCQNRPRPQRSFHSEMILEAIALRSPPLLSKNSYCGSPRAFQYYPFENNNADFNNPLSAASARGKRSRRVRSQMDTGLKPSIRRAVSNRSGRVIARVCALHTCELERRGGSRRNVQWKRESNRRTCLTTLIFSLLAAASFTLPLRRARVRSTPISQSASPTGPELRRPRPGRDHFAFYGMK